MAWNNGLATVPDATTGNHVRAGDQATNSVRTLIVGGASGGTAIPVQETRGGTATLSNVAASASNVTLLNAATTRVGVCLYNDSTSACYVKFGTTASSSSFTVKIFGQGFYVMQFPVYTGRIDAIWDSATGNMRVTELTP